MSKTDKIQQISDNTLSLPKETSSKPMATTNTETDVLSNSNDIHEKQLSNEPEKVQDSIVALPDVSQKIPNTKKMHKQLLTIICVR
jgi:hypothetical protein